MVWKYQGVVSNFLMPHKMGDSPNKESAPPPGTLRREQHVTRISRHLNTGCVESRCIKELTFEEVGLTELESARDDRLLECRLLTQGLGWGEQLLDGRDLLELPGFHVQWFPADLECPPIYSDISPNPGSFSLRKGNPPIPDSSLCLSSTLHTFVSNGKGSLESNMNLWWHFYFLMIFFPLFTHRPLHPVQFKCFSLKLMGQGVKRVCISQEERSWGRGWLCCLHQLHLGKLASGLVFLLRQFTCHLRSFCKGHWILLLSHCSSETIWGRKVLEFLNLSHLSRFSDSSYSLSFLWEFW